MTTRIRGVLAPVLTPFGTDLRPDVDLFIEHSRWLVDNHAGLAIFGTNSEAASLSVGERLELTDALLAAGIPAAKMMPGTGACAVSDAVTLTRHAVDNGAAGCLMLPPYFYKGVSDDGLFAYYAEVIERVGSDRLAVYLYHIPQMTHAPITLSLIERLLKRYPGVIAGAKDSSGDWANSKAMIDTFASQGFDVFPASESFLTQSQAIGGAGSISATVNVNPAGIHALYAGWDGPHASELQAKADVIRNIFMTFPMIPSMKAAVARYRDNPSWVNVRPPLTTLEAGIRQKLMEALDEAGFEMPGVRSVS
ncbi:dihydrodipicolinate synthase family protein [Xylophilus sp. Kf1]|nr:dihydrodipicolinate synthase family protein [Xylophilus sp. Kf1]